MTLKELNQLYYLERLIERDSDTVDRLESALLGGSSALTHMPHAPGVSDRVGDTVSKIIDLKKQLEIRIASYNLIKARIASFIDSIEDTHIKLIFLLRFVDGCTWNEVAYAISGNNTENSVKKICYRYLKSCPECPTCPEQR